MRCAGAADIGGTNTRVGLVSEDGTVIRIERIKTPVSGRAEDIAKAVGSILHEMTGGKMDTIAGIGVAAAGPIDIIAGTLLHPPNIPFQIVPITGPLTRQTGCTVRLFNDCRAAVLGEVLAGGGKGRKNVVYITISTGIGGGIFSGDTVLTGRGGNAGEIGHFPVDTTYSFPCTCGLTGHWEGYASGKGIPAFFQEWCRMHGYPCDGYLTASDILDLAHEDVRGREFRFVLAKMNGRGLSSVLVAYDPECIIFDGAVFLHHPDLMEEAIACTDRYLELPEFKMSPLNGNAPLIGAAMALFHPEML